MIRLSLSLLTIIFVLSFNNSSSAQIIFSNLTENPALLSVKNTELEERNYISSQRLVILAADTQKVCIQRPDLGFFDTLYYASSNVPVDIDFSIDLNCVTISAHANAPVSSVALPFAFVTSDGNILSYTIYVDIVKPLVLPFFDDFAYNSKIPDPARWVDKNVFINQTMAVDPPSIGVATFDGLNSNGTPYGGGFNRADYLTSNYIDLSGITANDSVYLSYFLQAKGNTYNHQQRDSIELEFKNDKGEWKSVASHKGISPNNPSDYIPPFQQYNIVVDKSFYHRGFQFRFVNYNYRLGVYSTWHLDYVKMVVNQKPSLNLMDIAFIKPPNKFLKTYSAIPYKQLSGHENEELANTTEIELYNHFLETAEDLVDPRLNIKEITTGTQIYEGALVNLVSQLNPAVGINRFSNAFDAGQIADAIASVPAGQLPLIFRTTYTFDQDQETPLLEENNKAFSDTEVGYTMAYDDGTAELNIAAEANNSTKSQIAVKFHLNEGDSLRAIQFHFPRLFDDVSKQLFNIKIWVGDLNKEEADYTYQLQKPIYADGIFDTLQGFTTYPLTDDLYDSIPKPLYIPAGDYYIGWQQFTVSSAGQFIPVGFDRNYKGGEAITYYKSTGDWKPLSELSTSPLLKGVPMIRAKFQNSLLTSATKDLDKVQSLSFYPNPSNGTIWLDKKLELPVNSTYKIYDAMGNKVQSGRMESQLNISNLQGNLYYIQVMKADGQLFGTSKIMVIR